MNESTYTTGLMSLALKHRIPSSCWFTLSSYKDCKQSICLSWFLTFHHFLLSQHHWLGGPPPPSINGKFQKEVNARPEYRWTTYLAQQVAIRGPATKASDSFSHLFPLPWMQPGLPPTSGCSFFLCLEPDPQKHDWGKEESSAVPFPLLFIESQSP